MLSDQFKKTKDQSNKIDEMKTNRLKKMEDVQELEKKIDEKLEPVS